MASMHCNRKNIFILILTALLWENISALGVDGYCLDLKPQNSVDMSQIMGMWYGIEVIPHFKEEADVSVFNTCPVIHIAEISYEQSRGVYSLDDYWLTTTESHIKPGSYGYQWAKERSPYDREYGHLRLLWEENYNTIEYYLKYNNTRKGFWISSGPQTGGSLVQRQYNQFAGTVQIMKAVGDHLVLTFCQRLPESQLFTIILVRDPRQTERLVIHTIHNLLNRRDLSTSSVRKVCNGSSSNKMTVTMVIFTIISAVSYLGIRFI